MKSTHRFLSSLLTTALVVAGLTIAPITPATAGSGLTLTKDAPDRSLLGETVRYTLRAANTSATGQFNVSFSDVLPPELEFDGNVIPTAAGTPKITTSGGQQVLTWLNVADLLAGSDYTLSFDAKYKTPVGPILTPIMTNTGTVATSDDPRDIPEFNPNGTVLDADNQATDTANTTKIGIKITKGEPSPEGELLRGVHDHVTVYSLTVTNNKVVPTNNVLVTDYIPAGMEFLGCAVDDNTTNQTPEYPVPPAGTSPPDAPPLGQSGVTVTPCPIPISVDTVEDPTAVTGIGNLSGVYTEVTWKLSDLQPNETVTIRYAAGIPLQENTTTWPNGKPAADTGEQGSNLDNNSGASTRETLSELALKNHAVVTGDFTPPVGPPVPTFDTATQTVTAEDLRMIKTVVPSKFNPGGVATFRFRIDTSEYMTADGITLTDLLPDGYCPLGEANYSNGDPACAPDGTSVPTINGNPVPGSYAKVEWKTDHYEVTFPQLPAMDDNDTVLVTMPARMLGEYRATGQPTVAGDTFNNKAELAGTTTPITAVTVESGPQAVQDRSEAEQSTILPTIDKQMKPRYIGVDCQNLVDEPYMESADMTDVQRTFRQGDTICFKLRVNFPNVSTKNAVIGDLVPIGTVYQAGSMWLTPNNTVPVGQVGFDGSGNPLLWTLGADDGGAKFVAPNLVFEAVIAVTVIDPPVGNVPDITGNLMKMRTVNTLNQAESYRDVSDYDRAPAPNLAIAKGVRNTSAPAGNWNPPQDHKPVQEGSQATFQVDVTNRPRPDFPGTEFSARGVQVWDALPGLTTEPQITCASIVAGSYKYIKPGTSTVADLPGDVTVSCADAQVVVNGSTVTRPTIKWSFPSPDLPNDYAIFTGQTLSVLYTVNVPSPVSVSVQWNNTAYVRSMDAFTNVTNVTSTYYPEKNVDPAVTQPTWNAQELKDPSDIYIPNATVTKTGTTSVSQTNNNTPNQATIGERITYTYGVKIPARSTVYNGVLSDTLPAGVELLASPAPSWTFDGQPGTLPNFSLDANGVLTFDPTYTNSTNTEQTFEVTVTAQVKKTAIACPGETDVCTTPPAPGSNVAKQNTARFNSKYTLNGTAIPERRRTYTVNIMQPAPRITKAANPETVKNSKEDITYTVTASNATGRSPLNNVIIVDCIPDEVTVKDPGLGTLDTNPNPNCTTKDKVSITWEFQPKGPSVPTALEDPLEPNTDRTFTYTANIKSGSNVNVKFPNTVTMGGTSMPAVVDGERTYVTGANAGVVISDGSIVKDVQPARATIGQTVTATIDVRLTDGTYTNLAIADTMPAGISVAPGSFTTVSVTCQQTDKSDYTDLTPCSTPNIGHTFLQPAGQTLGWALNPLPNQDKFRVIRVTYTARVTNATPANKAGDTKQNAATATYGYASQPTQISDLASPPFTIGTATDSFQIIEPNVEITKTVNGEKSITVLPDDTFEYKVTVTNADRVIGGTSFGATAYAVSVEDVVPAGVVITDTGGGVFNAGKITWPVIDELDIDGTVIYTYYGRLAGNTTTQQTNTAAVTQYFSLPPDPNNPDIRKYDPVNSPADVNPQLPEAQIEKFASADLAYINEPYTWTIKVTNPGQTDPAPTAYAIDVNDALPPNWTYKANTSVIKLDGNDVSKEPTVTPATGTDPEKLLWSNIANLPATSVILITFEATPFPGVVTDPGIGLDPLVPHINTATTSWYPGKPTDQWSPVTSKPVNAQTAIASADLQLLKSHVTDYKDPLQAGKDEVIPGTQFKWKMDVTNLGKDTSHGPFVLVDTLPAGNTYASWEGTGWTGCVQDPVNKQKITCTHPDLQFGLGKDESLEPLYIIVNVDLDAPPTMLNTATVTGRTFDPKPANNTDTDQVSARPQADVAIEKSSSGKYIVGEQVEYTLAVTNLGPSTARAPITVTDSLPAGLSIASYNAGPWQCTPAGGPATTVTCTLSQDLLPLEQAALIKILADVVESPGPIAKNCAVTGSPTEDQDSENNSSCVTDPVTSDSRLEISKQTTGANPVFAGRSTEFTITVTNRGPAEAKNVIVTDTLETGLKATSASGKGWTCDVGVGTTVTCSRKTLPVKASPSDIVISADVAADVPEGTTLQNVATVTTSSPGEKPPPTTSTVVVKTSTDLGIVKSHRKQPWTIGKQGRWYMTVTNYGPSNNPGPITVTDNLPRGTRYVQASGDGWQCQGAERSFACTLTTGLIVGQSSSEISVLVDVVEGAWPSVLNPATVTSPWPDSNPDNNTDTDEVPVGRAKQTVPPLPPGVVKGGKTDQGQKIRTRIRCLPLKASAAGEVSYCKVKKTKNDVYKIKVLGPRPMRVIVTQYAKGTKNYKPWKRVKRFILRP